MDFLKEFPNWAALTARVPSLAKLSEDEFKKRIYQNKEIPGTLFTLMEDVGADADFVKSYVAKYGEQNLRYGLATLLGVGKGANKTLRSIEDLNFILKYDPDVWQWDLDDRPEFIHRIRMSVMMARNALQKAHIELMKVGTPRESPQYKPALLEHFGIGDKIRFHLDAATVGKHLTRIKTDLSTIKGQLSSRFRIAASHDLKDALGYVQKKPCESSPLMSPYRNKTLNNYTHGSIHLDFNKFLDDFDSVEIMACTIIHEASHKWCHTYDNAYLHEVSKYKALPPELRLGNADSYANFVMQLYLNKPLQTVPGFIK